VNLLDAILDARGGGAVRDLSRNFGIEEGQAVSALRQLLPALSSGLKRNVGQPEGLESLLGALKSGNHARYLEDASAIGQPETVGEGNGILGHLLGSKDVSRRVAGRAAERTGLPEGLLKKMLPVVATLAMGALSKQTTGRGGLLTRAQEAPGGNLLNSLGPLLDADGDGSVMDDLFSIARKLF